MTSYLGFEPHCAARSANGSNTAIVSTMSIDVLSLVLVSDVPGQRERSRAFLPMGRVVSSLVDGAAVADEQCDSVILGSASGLWQWEKLVFQLIVAL